MLRAFCHWKKLCRDIVFTVIMVRIKFIICLSPKSDAQDAFQMPRVYAVKRLPSCWQMSHLIKYVNIGKANI